ncbi:alkylation response protein AidB-like acyl-CoA dehydrogenase [Allocatelliglobosispora scoriae]|uniref:Alkylation response protein AidB-like acyl-CoA dehydrogenase n=1 Tax=Allocatelliglobosispora scoriae TaxID=643052 RepID=A0A841BE00_9ACTN|nr:acyl-CoA dehydrogenase family protein [Allocatelliglobosispora scoriae]MBB5867327.1 alkylation response protein AidB-like acyl-CoA dehydrogenase [Allocatelliglobosispora scoriae]
MTDDAPTLFAGLRAGRIDDDLLAGFPLQNSADLAAGQDWVARAGAFADGFVDADEIDRSGKLPVELLDSLRREGLLAAGLSPELGGAGLSPYNVFRMVAAVSRRSMPVAQIIAVQAGLGAGALYPALPAGPLRDMVRERIGAEALSGFGDTDGSGQNNRLPRMTATRVDGGPDLVLRGEKLYTANGPVADLLAVSAVLDGAVCVCFVDTAAAGFSVDSTVEFVGSKGLPSGVLRFDGVRVAGEHVLSDHVGQLRLPPLINAIAFLGRIYFNGAPAMAIARNCLEWSREFVNRRSIDGRPLSGYDRIQRMVSATMADVYAMDCLARWCLIGSGLSGRWLERFVAKNALTRTAWRVADRTVSLLGAEGLETADSKRRRGAAPLPVERALRDARMLRVAGNVDFQLDNQAAQLMLADRDPDARSDRRAARLDLSPRNQAHLDEARGHARRFGEAIAGAAARHGVLAPHADQEIRVTLGRLVAELVTVCAVLGRTHQLGTPQAQALADVYCTGARHRLAGLWRRLRPGEEPDYAVISAGWLDGSSFEFLGAG